VSQFVEQARILWVGASAPRPRREAFMGKTEKYRRQRAARRVSLGSVAIVAGPFWWGFTEKVLSRNAF
jgi:hypothetical protein